MNKYGFILLDILLLLIIFSVVRQYKNNQLKEKIGQLLVVGFDGTTLDQQTRKELRSHHIGGVILFEKNLSKPDSLRNIADREQLKRLVEELQSIHSGPMFISIDQEGGTVARLNPTKGFYNPPSQKHIGSLNRIDSSRHYAALNARQLRELGINMNFTPCVDLSINPDNPIIALRERAFSDDPIEVAQEAAIVVEESHKAGIITSLKHFPGHGSSQTDSHMGLTDITNTYDPKELEPYASLIGQGYEDIVMVGHLFNSEIDASYPASLSAKTITGILRNQLGYEGVVATDDMHMQAITREYSYPHALELALNAGVDMIIIGNNAKEYEANLIGETCSVIYDLVKAGRIPEERIDEAYGRILRLKERLN